MANTRKEHANERADYEHEYQSSIADLRASALGDLAQYNDAQRRADTQLSKAKRALAKGDLEGATRHHEEYLRLIQVQATTDIKEGDRVVRSKKAGIRELIRDREAGHKIGLKLIEEAQRREEQAIQDKINLKQAELDMQRLHIDLQMQSAKIMAQLVKELTGIDYSATFTEFQKRAVEAQNKIEALLDRKRDLKIGIEVDTEPVDNSIKDAQTKADNTKLTPEVDADTKPIQDTVKKLKIEKKLLPLSVDIKKALADTDKLLVDVKKKQLKMKLEADIIEAKDKIDKLKKFSAKGTESTHHLDLIKARRDLNNLVNQLNSLQTQHTHLVIGKYIPPTIARQDGGLIPRFNTGGHLDNGIGHTRKTGSLGGYGGGDKIKALLEAGEFIVRKEAVKKLGLEALHQINQGLIPRFNVGGVVGQNPVNVNSQTTSKPNRTVELNLNIGGETFTTIADEDIANSLASYLQTSEF